MFYRFYRSHSSNLDGKNHFNYLSSTIYAGQEATVRTGHGTTDWFQIRKGLQYIVKAVYCHPVYLTYMQSTS